MCRGLRKYLRMGRLPQEVMSNWKENAYFAGGLLSASLSLLFSLVSLLLLKLANEVRTMLLNQTHLDGAMVAF